MIVLRAMNLSLRKTKILLWSLAVTAELSQIWANRFYIEPDGVNYLDIANAYQRHDWRNALSSHWSPLWSWLLAAFLQLFHSSAYWESTLVHVLNFVVYLLALLCFASFLNALMALCSGETDGNPDTEGLPAFAWLVWACVTATHVFLTMIGARLDTPDLCVAVLFFLATTLLIRMRRGHDGWSCYAALGATLGLAFLAKTVMFLLAFVFLFCAFFATSGRKRAIPRVLLALLVFAALSGPFVLALSKAKGRPTFGDSGRNTYMWFVNGVGTPTHGLRKISDQPVAFEYSSPIAGTYPPYYDPTYWYEGVRPQFDLRAQFHCLALSARGFFVILSAQRAVAVGVLVLLFFAGDWFGFYRRLAGYWTVWLPAAATFLLYSFVHVESRFLPAAALVLWCSVLASIRLPRQDQSRRLANSVTIAVAIALGITIASLTAENVAVALRRPPHVDWQVAQDLHQMGLRPGESVAVLGQELRADYWARLAQVRVVAELPEDALDSFWRATPEKQAILLDAFARSGAKVLVTHFKPPAAHSAAWQNLDGTGYYALPLSIRAPR